MRGSKPCLIRPVVERCGKIRRINGEIADQKKFANYLCEMMGRPPMFEEVGETASVSIGNIGRDQWYGQPISTAIREYLSMRKSARMGPATVNEIYDALVSGGFSFEARDAENAKRGLRISLTKNTSIFHRLPDGKHFGLLEWYPEVKAKKEREPQQQEVEDDDEAPHVEVKDEKHKRERLRLPETDPSETGSDRQ